VAESPSPASYRPGSPGEVPRMLAVADESASVRTVLLQSTFGHAQRVRGRARRRRGPQASRYSQSWMPAPESGSERPTMQKR
jgi:hypothetical protein